jgi:hypothetical protein
MRRRRALTISMTGFFGEPTPDGAVRAELKRYQSEYFEAEGSSMPASSLFVRCACAYR